MTLTTPSARCRLQVPMHIFNYSPLRTIDLPILPSVLNEKAAAMEFHVDKILAGGDADSKPTAGVDEEELQQLRELAGADSLFCKVAGVHVHHKICRPDQQAGGQLEATEDCKAGTVKHTETPTILFHGFGASVFSWEGVMKPLAQMTGSEVLAFDRPAFGITSRPPPAASCGSGGSPRLLNPYSTAFSVFTALSFMNLLGGDDCHSILIGHSAGCLVAIETYFQAPEKVAALILVAPAILAPFAAQKKKMVMKGQDEEVDNKAEGGFSDCPARWFCSFTRIHDLFDVVLRLLHGMMNFVASICTQVLSAFLKSDLALMLIRAVILKFGVQIVKTSWFDATQASDHVIEGYTKPLKARGWEKGILEYLLALLTESSSKQPLSRRLAQISCPVLIITGDTDRLVPSWNSKRLSKVIPGSSVEVIKNCGHTLHEERKEEFMSVVKRFLDTVHGVRTS